MAQQQALAPCPEPLETADLHFKLVCKLKIFDPQDKSFDSYTNLVATAQKYGLAFIGTSNGFIVIKTTGINSSINTNEFLRKEIVTGNRPSHISVDYNQDLLAVGCSPQCAAHIYKISHLSQQKVSPLTSISLVKNPANPNVQLHDLIWQPYSPSTFTCCFNDGSVLGVTLGPNGCQELMLPASTQALCMCWSPKGKQIVIGSDNGTLSQYKPDLKLVKTLPAPLIFQNGVSAVSVLWISSFQFAAAFKEKGNDNAFPVIVIVNAVKNEPITFINYEDITYCSSLFRVHQIYMLLQSAWNLMIVSSANSMEVAVLHAKEDNTTWEQWLLADSSRAELPLNSNHQETFPIGLALDYSVTENIPWGENFIPPMPRLLLLSHEGVLCVFNIVNLGNVPQLCSAPKEAFDDSLFTFEIPKAVVQPQVVQQPQSTTSFFGTAKPSYSFGGSSFAPLSSTSSQPASTLSFAAPATQSQSIFAPQTTPAAFGGLGTQASGFGAPGAGFGVQTTGFGAQSSFSTPSTQAPAKSLFGAPPISQPAVSSTPPQTSFAQTQPQKTFSLSGNNLTGAPKPEQAPAQNLFGFSNKKPEVNPSEASFGVKAPEPKPEQSEPEKKISAPSPAPSPAASTPEPPAVDDSIYLNAVLDEIDHFNSELQLLSGRVSNFQAQVGTSEEKILLRKKLDNLYEFWKELKETTISQNTEIHSVKADMMESFAWLEDAKSRNAQRKNPTYVQLKRSEELDPISSRHMTDVAHLKYYIENQLKQLNDYLDKEWMEHQDNCRKDVKNRMIIPSMEEVYKTMHYQLKILNKHRIFIEDLKRKLSEKSQKTSSQASIFKNVDHVYNENLGNTRVSELSKLAENLLQLKISREETNPLNAVESWKIVAKAQVNAIAQRSKKLTSEKQAALRDALSERDMIRTRPVKSTFETSTFIRNIASELKERSEKKIMKEKETKEKIEKPKPNTTDTFFKSVTSTSTPIKIPPVAPPVEAMGDASKTITESSKKPAEPAKNLFSFGQKEKPNLVAKEPEEKCPLASLSGIVSNIGKEIEAKPQQSSIFNFATKDVQKVPAFTFGQTKPAENVEVAKTESFSFSSFASPKPTESTVKVTSSKFPPTQEFSFSLATTKPVATTSIVQTTSVIAAPADTTTTSASGGVKAPSFSFTSPTPPATTTGSFFQKSKFTLNESGSIFGAAPTTTTSSVFGSLNFGSVDTSTAATTTVSIFSTPTKPKMTEQKVMTVAPTISETVTPPAKTITNVFTPKSASTPVPPPETQKNEQQGEKEATPTPPATPTTANITFGENLTIQAKPEVTTTPVTTTTGLFAQPLFSTATPPTTSVPSVFGGAATATPAPVTTTPPPYSTPQNTSIFGTPTTSSIFSAPTTTANIFAQVATTTTATTPSIFGTPTTSASIFGSPTTTTQSIFGQITTPTTSAPSFGQKTDVSQATNLFGQLLSGTLPTSVFGGSSTPTTTSTNLFSQTGFEQTTSSIFGGSTATTSSAPLFGTTSSSPFQQSGSLFGQASTTTSSVFGQPATTTTTNVFGQPAATTSSSFFGQNICSPFGGTTTVAPNQNPFGSTASSAFGSKPVFGQSLFGQGQTSTSTFGGSSGGSIFGGSTTSSGNLFAPATTSSFGSTPGPFSAGQNSVAQSGFGSPASFQKPLGGFGGSPGFGGGSSSTPAFGSAPTFSGAPTFGSPSAFGSPPKVFGGSPSGTGGTFGQAQTQPTAFENLANQQTVGFGNLAQQAQQSPPPSFGGNTSFGSPPPSFGGAPSFSGNSFSSWR